jgi:hypothetical protein
MDLRYRVWPGMHRLGIWINVNVYLFIWIKLVPFFFVLFGSKFWIPEQKMARKNVSANQNGKGGGKWEW